MTASFHNDLQFYLNGKPVVIRDPDPSVLLVDYLRSTEVGLTGTKKACGQGGCGACTVMLAQYDTAGDEVVYRSINSCLRPLCTLDGCAVTTTEGLGSTRTCVSKVQDQVARDNGTQCGYCTPGWVMHMQGQLAAYQGKALTQKEIEGFFDGNICRCTGYRPILYAMKHFAADWGPEDEKGSMTCLVDPAQKPAVEAAWHVSFPDALKKPMRPLHYRRDGYDWYRPTTMAQLLHLTAVHDPAVSELKYLVGNTSIGVYDRFVENPHFLIDIGFIDALHQRHVGADALTFGAAVSYSDALATLEQALKSVPAERRSGLRALHYLAGRTAGTIVRNAASLAGNTMLVARHVAEGEPFPSDLFTAMCALGAEVDVHLPGQAGARRMPLHAFAATWHQDPALGRAVLEAYHIPLTAPDEVARTYKCAIRHENAHAVVNAGLRVALDAALTVTGASVVYGGIGPIAFEATAVCAYLKGRRWNAETLTGALALVRDETAQRLKQSAARMESVPADGFSDAYRIQLAETFFYQYFLYVLEQRAPAEVPPALLSAGRRQRRRLTRGTQQIQTYKDEYPVSLPFIKPAAFQQTTGEVVYTHDIPLPVRGVQAALVTSAAAYARFWYVGPDGTRLSVTDFSRWLCDTVPGVVDYAVWRDVPGKLVQGYGGDEPILAPMEAGDDGAEVGTLYWFGQAIGVVTAESEQRAIDVAHFIQNSCIHYDGHDANGQRLEPVLTIDRAVELGRIFPDQPDKNLVHIWKITRAGSKLGWTHAHGLHTVDGIACRVVHAVHESDAQVHFYMETQSCVVEPGTDKVTVHPSSQSPDDIQTAVAQTLGHYADAAKTQLVPLPANKIAVKVHHLGGGYGGKTTRSPFTAAVTAVAAAKLQRPVRLAMAREVDTATVGKRHPLKARLRLAIGTGEDRPENKGRLVGLSADYLFDGGYTYDCSFVVMDCLQLRSDSAYMVPNYQTSGDVAQTNKASNTAYRAFGMIQSMCAVEDAIEQAAYEVGLTGEEVRARNLYQLGDQTPYGEYLTYCYLSHVWAYAVKVSGYKRRLARVEAFNRKNKWRKRGIALMPLKYGSGYNLTGLEQGGALIEVYSDGTILVRQGGVEMGQGMLMKILQIAAYALNAPLALIQMGETDTQVVPNPVSTGASTGTALNGGAVKKAGTVLRKRLEEYCLGLLRKNGAEWCRTNGVNFWDYEEGWRAQVTVNGRQVLMWTQIAGMAQWDRVNLSAQVRYQQGGGGTTDTGLTFKAGSELVQNFVGYTYNAACSEVEIDVLTGETVIRRSDIIYDMGKSLNPAIDVGQVEGAFMQGVGYVLTEKTVFQPDGPDRGRLNTLNTWTYKPPATSTLPERLNVHLFPRELAADVPENPHDLMSAKEVGEPPLVLATTVYLAVKKAIMASRIERGLTDWVATTAPATPEVVREACAVTEAELTL